METYDIVMLIVLGAAGIFGAIKGFAWQLASIASIGVSYWVAVNFREPFSQQIQADPPWNRFLSMLILFLGTAIAIWIVFRMISTWIERVRLKEFDRTVGFAFGLIKGTIYCILITMFAVALLGESVRDRIVGSRSGYYITKILDHSEQLLPAEIHQVVHPYLERFDERMRAANSSPTSNAPLTWPAPSASDNNLLLDQFPTSIPWQSNSQQPPTESPSQTQATAPIDSFPRR